MFASFDVTSHIKSYRVSIGGKLLDGCVEATEDHIFLCDQFFALRLSSENRRVISVEATEARKSLDRMSDIIICLREAGVTRETILVAVGGGVIQDIATFCASIYMRGIPWMYWPTTLLGMVDSCIGGKSAINVGPYKNIVGNYCPPAGVFIDPSVIQSLGIDQKVAGLCEAAKICYARGGATFDRYLELKPAPDMSEAQLAELIKLSLQAKKWFIEIDEFDQKERLLLNFGHTFGHALEGATGFRISHGVAVGLGMLAALYYARMVYGMDHIAQRARMLEAHVRFLLVSIPNLREILAGTDPATLYNRFLADKKHTGSAYVIVGLGEDGALTICQLPHGAKTTATVRGIFEAMVQSSFLEDGFASARVIGPQC